MITIEKFDGLITNASRYAIPGGSFSELINLQCLSPGRLEGRSGLAQAATVDTGEVVAAVRLPTGLEEKVVCQCGTKIVVVSV